MSIAECASRYPQEVLKEAKNTWAGARVLRGRPLEQGFTIDGPTSKDLDDGIWVERSANGYNVRISIAQVSAFIEPGSALDKEALNRGASFYPLDYADHMFPKILSEDRMSLIEGTVRPAITTYIALSKDLSITDYNFNLTAFENIRRLDHKTARGVLEDSGDELHSQLKTTSKLANGLSKRRAAKGGRAYFDFFPASSFNTDKIVRELMILNNEVIAGFFSSNGIPTIYRNHNPSNGNSERACYSDRFVGHKGLALEVYTHFTSPIRRYSDLIVQRLLVDSIIGRRPCYTTSEIQQMVQHINETRDQGSEDVARVVKDRIGAILGNGNTEALDMILQQVKNDEISVDTAFAVLACNNGHNPQFENIKEEIIDWAFRYKGRTERIMEQLRREFAVNGPQFNQSGDGMVAKIQHNGVWLESQPQRGNSKEESRQMALHNLLKQIFLNVNNIELGYSNQQ